MRLQVHRLDLVAIAIALNLLVAGGVVAVTTSARATAITPTNATFVETNQPTASTSLVSAAVTRSGPQLMVAYLASDSAGPGAGFSSVTGCGLSWS